MGLESLRKITQTFQSKPKQEPAPIRASEWVATNRVDGVAVHEGEAAANFYTDGVTPAQRAGIEVEIALLDQKKQQREQVSFEQFRAAQDRVAYEAYLRGER